MQPPIGQGVHGSGGRAYNPKQRAAVVAVLKAHIDWVTVEVIRLETGISGRTIRQIVGDVDGDEVLVSSGNNGYRVCTTVEEAYEVTHRLASQVEQMTKRLQRRQRFLLENTLDGPAGRQGSLL